MTPLPPASPGINTITIEVVVPDPGSRGEVEVRILADGDPVIAKAFDKGSPNNPEQLLNTGRLRASAQPHEVQLAEAYCTEGCCGALYVTIQRDDDTGTVIWHQWRTPAKTAEPLPALRFDAKQYDTEITRAEAGHDWEWPARTVARLVRERLRREPDLLDRWDCRPGQTAARNDGRDQLRMTFTYPADTTFGEEQPWLQFEITTTIDHQLCRGQDPRIDRRQRPEDHRYRGRRLR